MKINKATLVSLISVLTALHGATHADVGEEDYYIVVSLRNVKAALQDKGSLAETARNLAWITNPIALVTSDDGDLMLVGSRNSSDTNLTIADLAVLFRNRATLDEGKESPGISIEPSSEGKWHAVQYYGRSVRGSRVGELFFNTDMMLKWLSDAYITTGIDGLPTEWELDLHRQKLGMRIEERYHDIDLRYKYFYPETVRMTHAAGANGEINSLFLHSLIIKVMPGSRAFQWRRVPDYFHVILAENDVSGETIEALGRIRMRDIASYPTSVALTEDISRLLQEDAPHLETKQRRRIIKIAEATWKSIRKENARQKALAPSLANSDAYLRYNESPSFAFAEILSSNFIDLMHKYRALSDFYHVMKLLYLCDYSRKMSISAEVVSWLDEYPVDEVEPVDRLTPLERSIIGVGFSRTVVGGILIPPAVSVPEEESYEAKAGSPSAVRHVVLQFRPDRETLAWLVPVGDAASEATPKVFDAIRAHNSLSVAELILNQADGGRVEDPRTTAATAMSYVNSVGNDIVSLSVRKEALAVRANTIADGLARSHSSDDGSGIFPLHVDNGLGTWEIGRGTIASTPKWHPSTTGENMIEVSGEISFNNGGSSLLWPEKLYLNPSSSSLGFGYAVQGKAVFDNRLMIEARLPFEYQFTEVPASKTLPGLVKFSHKAGLSNVEIGMTYHILGESYRRPVVDLIGDITTPLRLEILNTEKEYGSVGVAGWDAKFGVGVRCFLSDSLFGRGDVMLDVESDDDTAVSGVISVNPMYFIGKRKSFAVGVFGRLVEGDRSRRIVGLSFDTFTPNRHLSSLVGLHFVDGESYYFYQTSIPFNFLSFRFRRWFEAGFNPFGETDWHPFRR